jgi:3'-phosphoadenosine 5'-phosphosulfate sulfotransferase (PAPS reductase)/FAD synthetase
MDDPFRVPRPCVMSFSGGRTSGYLLWRVLQAHGGTLPEDVRPVFLNTGRERPETLDFVARCEREWNVNVTWLEYRTKAKHKVVQVDYGTASRDGEPFAELIIAKQHLPNVMSRYCTTWLKVKPNNRWARHTLGWGDGYFNTIGLRYDEPRRLEKLRRSLARYPKHLTVETLFGPAKQKNPMWAEPPPPGEKPIVPLALARVTSGEVMEFWQGMRGGLGLEAWLALPKAERPGWDLELMPDEGNCDLCFLKGPLKLVKLIQARPELADWWRRVEAETKARAKKPSGARFIKNPRHSYDRLAEMAGRVELPLADFLDAPGGLECTFTCTD